MARELREADEPGLVKFVVNGLKIEHDQYEILQCLKGIILTIRRTDYAGRRLRRTIPLCRQHAFGSSRPPD